MHQSAQQSSGHGEILVVDDTPASLTYLADLLTAEGYTVRVAPSGELALWTAGSRPPDLVLLDVRMPGLDGFQVCKRLKDNPATERVPVVFLSAQSDIEDKVLGFRVGGVDFIGKPFAAEEVLQRVATHIRIAKLTKALAIEALTLEERVLRRTEELQRTADELRAEVAARRAAEVKLRLAASAFEASLSATMITDPEGNIVAVNPAFTILTGYPSAEAEGSNASILNSDKHDAVYFAAMWDAIKTEGRWSGEIWNRRKDGNVFPCLHTISAVRDGDAITHYVGVFLDLSESKDAQTLIGFLTRHDRLTGLPNRVLVRDRFEQMVVGLDDAAETLAVICINLDKFRHINEFHGHPAGDEVLRWVASELTECMPTRDTLYREGGDEFYLIHRESSDLLGVQMLVDSLQQRLNAELPIDEQRIALTASLGVALYPADGRTLEELSGNAAIAMARAKAQGGMTNAFFSEKLDQGVRTRFDLAQRLRNALGRQEFEVYYQPQVDARTGHIVAAEALLRWRSPELGFVSPAQFIPVAEETGQIVELGGWVLRTVCQQIAAWQAAGHGEVRVAVNLSAVQFMREDLLETVVSSLRESGISPALLELEITESAIISDVERAISTMNGIKAMGIALSLDDFGTGYSSLNYLKRFPLDYLKIDQSFVRDLTEVSDAQAIVRSIIGLAHNLQMKVVAEGVETVAQRDYLAANDCDVLQGYLFARPVPAADFLAVWQSDVALSGKVSE